MFRGHTTDSRARRHQDSAKKRSAPTGQYYVGFLPSHSSFRSHRGAGSPVSTKPVADGDPVRRYPLRGRRWPEEESIRGKECSDRRRTQRRTRRTRSRPGQRRLRHRRLERSATSSVGAAWGRGDNSPAQDGAYTQASVDLSFPRLRFPVLSSVTIISHFTLVL